MIHPEIDALIKNYVHPDKPGAAVAVVQDGVVIHQVGYGLASLEWGIPITDDTVFKIASITKTFTATAVMMLVERGKITLDAPITAYLPDFHTAGHRVTVEHLLNHSSGIHNYFSPLPGEDLLRKLQSSITPQELMLNIASVPFDSKPGTKAAYSNSNYVLLAQIIERVSEQPYETFVQENILNPLGMNHTYFLEDNSIFPQLASGYFNSENGVIPVPYFNISWTRGSGGMASTAKDLIRWDAAMREGELLSSDSLHAMITPLPLEDGSLNTYGYSWSITAYENHLVTYHSGNLPGFRLLLVRFPQDDLSIIVLSNFDGNGVNPYKVGSLIARFMLGLPEIRRRPFIVGGEAIGKTIGLFGPVQITAEEGKLFALLSDPLVEATKLRLMPMNSKQFYNTDYPEEIFTFSDEQDGVFTTLTVTTPLERERIFKRT